MRQHHGFAEHRHQNREDRQILLRSARASIAIASSSIGGAPSADRDQNALEDKIAEIENADDDIERDQRAQGREGQSAQDRA